jgi:hypothetical protein
MDLFRGKSRAGMLGPMASNQQGRSVVRLALVAALVVPQVAGALTSSNLRDLADPVTPGGVLAYRVTLVDQTPAAPAPPTCFNPPAECVTMPVTCSNPPPSCTGSQQAGFVCQNAANNGANCGVGSPPVADPMLCIQNANGTCNGGPNYGLTCSAPDGSFTSQCPGFTFLCKRAVNEDAYCGTTSSSTPQCIGDTSNGFFCAESLNNGAACGTTAPDPSVCQPDPNGGTVQPNPSFCLSHPSGICSGGPNFGMTCTAPHGSTTAECPAAASSPAPTTVTVDLPMPAGTSFMSADNGGSSNGTSVVWTVPAPGACAPNCAPLNANLLVDPAVPEGTVLQSQATTTDADGFLVSAAQSTTIARMQLGALTLSRGSTDGRGRFSYRTKFSLNTTESLAPGSEAFALRVSNASGPLVDFALAAGQVPESSLNVFTFKSHDPGIRALVLRQVGPGLWSLRVRASRLTVPAVTGLTITIELTIGDDTFTQPARFLVKGGGRRFVATTAP